MDKDLVCFCRQWLRVVVMTLVPVAFTAFTTIPFNLGGHPGEVAAHQMTGERHFS